MPDPEPTDDYAADLERIFPPEYREGNFYLFDSQIRIIREAAALIRRQAEEVARLRLLLAEVQWQDIHAAPCFICENPKERGHAPRCRLKAALNGPG